MMVLMLGSFAPRVHWEAPPRIPKCLKDWRVEGRRDNLTRGPVCWIMHHKVGA